MQKINDVWFSFKGVRNTDMNVLLASFPSRVHPAEKGEQIAPAGTDGRLWLPETDNPDFPTYDGINIIVSCCTADNADIDSVNTWLSGSGLLIFSDEPTKAYNARITKAFSRSNQMPKFANQTFQVVFDCEPFRYLTSPTDITVSASKQITNAGSIYSRPLIRANGTGAGSVMIGSQTMLLTDISGYIMIDCARKIAYKGTPANPSDPFTLQTLHVSGSWFVIPTGNSMVSFTGNITGLVITPRWRWL